MAGPEQPGRRSLMAGAGAAALLAATGRRGFGAAAGGGRDVVDVSGIVPDLAFGMRRASDGREVGAQDYRGRIVLMFFGYTHCPDVCPLTMGNILEVLARMGPAADRVQVLFVTVDPVRDSLAVLRRYTEALGPRFDGLRGTANQLAILARRFRVTYAVYPATATKPYRVLHGPSIYVFDGHGRARMLIPKLDGAEADTAAVARRLVRLAGDS